MSEEIAVLLSQHKPFDDAPDLCSYCGDDWPCEGARAGAEIERLTAKLKHAREGLHCFAILGTKLETNRHVETNKLAQAYLDSLDATPTPEGDGGE